MSTTELNSIPRLLDAAEGNPASAPELLAQVYAQLRSLAQSYLRAERPGHTLQATALVHEAYMRLAGGGAVHWDSPMQFFAAAAETMRRVLIDHARARLRLSRGGDHHRIPLTDLPLIAPDDPDAFLELDAAIGRLAVVEPAMAQVVQLRYLVGLEIEQTAQVMGISPATVKRRWQWARAWLFREISSENTTP